MTKILSCMLAAMIFLAGCGINPGPAPALSTAEFQALVSTLTTQMAATQQALPTSTRPVPTPSPYPSVTPSPLPTGPAFPFMTPEAAQAERWQEYEKALGSAALREVEQALCEWEILGRTGPELYVWAVCESKYSVGKDSYSGSEVFPAISIPAVIRLAPDGAVLEVELPLHGLWSSELRRLFPEDIRRKFEYYNFGRAQVLVDHIDLRRGSPGVPPLFAAGN